LYGRCSRVGPVIPNVLPVNDAAQITVNPSNHTVTVNTPNGPHTVFLPDGPSVIDIGHDGAVSLKAKQFGAEVKPYGGIGYADQLRVIGGVDLLYFHRFDGGIGVTVPVNQLLKVYDIRAVVAVSYTLFSNTRLTLGIDNQQAINGFVTLRF
jgi:hypothetical protein